MSGDNQSSRSPRQKVVGGDRAGQVLKSTDTINYLMTGAELATAAANKQSVPPVPDWQDEPDIVLVRNDTEDNWERGWAVDISTPLIPQYKRLESWWQHREFIGVKPLPCSVKYLGRIAVTAEPIRKGAIGRAYASGVCKSRLRVTDFGHEYADVDPVEGGYKLISRSGGSSTAQVLEVHSDQEYGPTTGELWATLRLQNGTGVHFVCKAAESIAGIACESEPCPVDGVFAVYYLDPCLQCLKVLKDANEQPVTIRARNLRCAPIAVDTWCIPHCDRHGNWWAEPEPPQVGMLRASECIRPGLYGSAKVQRVGDNGWEDDPAYPYAMTVDNSDCLVFALPGELFPAIRASCCLPWTPSGEHGLTRRVRIDTCIACDAKGTASVLKMACGSCENVEAMCGQEPAVIEVCNTSGRPVAGCCPEYAVAHLNPKSPQTDGGSGSTEGDLDCCWWIQAGPYPTRARGELKAPLCPDGTASVENVTFPGFCGDWTPPTTATNPYGLPGCAGAVVEMMMSFNGCECEWEITIVKPKIVGKLVQNLSITCNDESCTLNTHSYENVAVWSCDSTVCADMPIIAVAATGAYVEVLDDLAVDCATNDGCGGLRKSYSRLCVFCSNTTDDVVIPFTTQTFLTDITREDGGCTEGGAACSLKQKAVTVCGLFCTTGESHNIAFSFTAVDVYGPPAGDSCDCDGVYLGRRTILAPCVCDAQADEKVLSFAAQDVIEGFTSPSVGSTDNCELSAKWRTVRVIDCGACEGSGATSGEYTILEGAQVSVVTEVVCGDCLATVVTALCVISIGDESQVAATDCGCEPCDTGSGS